MSASAPALFVFHGAPSAVLEDNAWTKALAEFGSRLRPSAIAAVSAHWEERQPVRVSASERHQTLHDFAGFPAALYQLRYPASGDPELAAEIVARLEGAACQLSSTRFARSTTGRGCRCDSSSRRRMSPS
ncbi:MAG: DODA-type extradiol aromatic ring-opening family dioxygenase [Thermoanaerobaculia bacterium]